MATAEELVQETFLAGLQSIGSFDERSTLRTWLTSILRHKIADHHRKRAPVPVTGDLAGLEQAVEGLFDRRGIWKSKPRGWGSTPDAGPEREEFVKVLQSCLAKLPPEVADLLVLYEQRGVPAERLAEAIGITRNNLGVRFYRARMALRECLDRSWFGRPRS